MGLCLMASSLGSRMLLARRDSVGAQAGLLVGSRRRLVLAHHHWLRFAVALCSESVSLLLASFPSPPSGLWVVVCRASRITYFLTRPTRASPGARLFGLALLCVVCGIGLARFHIWRPIDQNRHSAHSPGRRPPPPPSGGNTPASRTWGGIVVLQRFRHRGGGFRAVGLFRGRCHRAV